MTHSLIAAALLMLSTSLLAPAPSPVPASTTASAPAPALICVAPDAELSLPTELEGTGCRPNGRACSVGRNCCSGRCNKGLCK